MDLMKDPKSGEVYAVKRQQLSRNDDEQEYNDHELCLLSNFECDFIVKLISYGREVKKKYKIKSIKSIRYIRFVFDEAAFLCYVCQFEEANFRYNMLTRPGPKHTQLVLVENKKKRVHRLKLRKTTTTCS